MTQTGTTATAHAPDAIDRFLAALDTRDAQVDYRVAVTPVSYGDTLTERARLDAQAERLFSVLGF